MSLKHQPSKQISATPFSYSDTFIIGHYDRRASKSATHVRANCMCYCAYGFGLHYSQKSDSCVAMLIRASNCRHRSWWWKWLLILDCLKYINFLLKHRTFYKTLAKWSHMLWCVVDYMDFASTAMEKRKLFSQASDSWVADFLVLKHMHWNPYGNGMIIDVGLSLIQYYSDSTHSDYWFECLFQLCVFRALHIIHELHFAQSRNGRIYNFL